MSWFCPGYCNGYFSTKFEVIYFVNKQFIAFDTGVNNYFTNSLNLKKLFVFSH